ncbi:MAG TPA: BrnT family toxin [Allosphingosinicella sp.]|jgi:hypothetical protein
MKVTYDPVKRQRTLAERGLDFDDAPQVFAGFHITDPDTRKDYGEDREITVGLLGDVVIVMVWTERPGSRRIISMRKADRDEREDYFKHMDRPG